MKNILIIGATSAIAQATARLYAADNENFYLIARNKERLDNLAKDLGTRGASSVNTKEVDFENSPDYRTIIGSAFEAMNEVDICLIAHGALPDQQACQDSVENTLAAIHINGTSTIALLTEVANRMEAQQSGTIAVITSVAGDRGRQSNYVYGSAKAMVSTFLQGLRNRIYKSGVRVIDVKPGFVDTPMTASLTKGLLWSQPADVAKVIYKAIQSGREKSLYAPCFWRIIMTIICSIPESIFKRLKL